MSDERQQGQEQSDEQEERDEPQVKDLDPKQAGEDVKGGLNPQPIPPGRNPT